MVLQWLQTKNGLAGMQLMVLQLSLSAKESVISKHMLN